MSKQHLDLICRGIRKGALQHNYGSRGNLDEDDVPVFGSLFYRHTTLGIRHCLSEGFCSLWGVWEDRHWNVICHYALWLSIGSKVVPSCGFYLGSYKVIPKRNYFGAYGYGLPKQGLRTASEEARRGNHKLSGAFSSRVA